MPDCLARGGHSKPVGPAGSAAKPGAHSARPGSPDGGKQGFYDGEVRRDPWQSQDLGRVAEVEPAQFVVILQRLGLSPSQFGEPDPHRRLVVERPARGGFCRQLGPEPHQYAQFFAELAVQGVFGCFAWLHFSARELPHAGKLRRRRAPRHKEQARFGQGVHYCAANDANESSHAHQSKAAAGQAPGAAAA